MKKNLLTVLVTALLSGIITFLTTKNIYQQPKHSENINDSIPLQSLGPTFPVSNNAHAYPVDSAIMGIDTLQSIATMLDTLNCLEGKLPRHSRRGVVGYKISAFDLLGAMGIPHDGIVDPPYKFVRVYLGFDQSKGYRMFVVPVSNQNCCGTDLFFNQDANGHLQINDTPGRGDFVLDLISPCPTTCDTNSRLVHDIMQQVGCECDQLPENKTK